MMAKQMKAYVHGVGLAAPGLPDWQTGQAVFRGEVSYQAEPIVANKIQLLPRNEARRAGLSVRLAFQAAEEACVGINTATLASVFASSAADISIAEKICSDLADPAKSVSPTQFHNSVHNTAAGYWGIATGCREPANSVAGGIDSFVVGLREAWALLLSEVESVLLVCFDTEGSGLLHAVRPSIHASCALAMVLSRKESGAVACLSDLSQTDMAPTTFDNAELEHFRQHNPAARGFALLSALAAPGKSQVVVESRQGSLALSVDPLA